MSVNLTRLYNYRKISDLVILAGQPSEPELQQAASEGYEVVINLALHDAEYSLPDERAVVESHGLVYEHIPVIWERPEQRDFETFTECMNLWFDNKRLIHCAANKRVSVFVALYYSLNGVADERWSRDKAMDTINEIWRPDEIWMAFIKQALTAKEDKQIRVAE